MTALRVGIVGAGGIGKRRAAALGPEAMPGKFTPTAKVG